jgi:hypothetical protein
LQAQLRKSGHWSGELRHVCKDSREVMVDSRMQLVGDDFVLEVNRDVTSAAVFRNVFHQSGIFAGIMDLRGYLREANNLSLEWCGYTKEQVLDLPVLGYALVARLRRSEGENSLRNRGSCLGSHFSRRASILACGRRRAHCRFCNTSHP